MGKKQIIVENTTFFFVCLNYFNFHASKVRCLLTKNNEEDFTVHAHGCIGDTGDGSKKHYRKSS